MDAKISVDSQFGVGTTFALELEIQMCDDYYSSITPEGEIDLSSLSGKRVLLCEDHPIHADQIIKMLESVGIKCERAANGLEGMTVFNFMPVGYFDAILMDIHMPVMDGIELTEKLRSMDRIDSRIIPVIAITSNAYDEDRQTAIDAGMNDYIAKPVDREQLYKVLWRAVCLDR